MTNTADTDTRIDNPNAAVTYVKGENWGDPIYHVLIDGVKVGWVGKENFEYMDNYGKWTFYAHVRPGVRADRLARDFDTRRDAVMEGLSSLRIHHGGGVYRLNMDTIKDELVVFSSPTLEGIWQRMLDAKYPMA